MVMQLKKAGSLICAGVLSALILAGCGGAAESTSSEKSEDQAEQQPAAADLSKIKDGVYTGKSSTHLIAGHSEISITVAGHKITAVAFTAYDRDGNVKGVDYGKGMSDSSYKKAQNALKANENYREQLLQKQSLDDVDAISGATISYHQFKESAEQALQNTPQ